MDGKDILKLKKDYDGIAYIPYQDNQRGNKRIYYRSPSVSEYVKYSIEDNETIKFECIQSCVVTVTDSTGTAEEAQIDDFLDYLAKENSGFILTLFSHIMALSPLSDKERCVSTYQKAKQEQRLLINTIKLDFMATFRDYRLVEACDGFSFDKFIKYVVMLEELKGTQGVFISELVDDPKLMEPQVRDALKKIEIANKQMNKKNKRPNFPANINNIDPHSADPALQNAISAAQQALHVKMEQDAFNVKNGKKSYVNFDAENKENNKN